MTSDQPRAVITPEVLAFWAADTLRVERSFERVKREMESGLCDVCGTPLQVTLAAFGPHHVTYACEHGGIKVPQ